MRIVLYIAFIFLIACSEDKENRLPKITPEELQEQLLKANKNALTMEKNQIEDYIKEKELEVIASETGLKYVIYHNEEGELIKTGQKAIVNYSVTLLDGRECYNTNEGPEEFVVGKDYLESGLHEGITYMSKGDKAKIIIPSHLAHGLAGDFKKIPVRSTIIYDIELLDVK